jgi:FeS assembly SUF system protein
MFGFRSKSIADAQVASQEPAVDRDELRGRVIDALRQVQDPEIPVNLYDLGLIYRLEVDAEGIVDLDMTLTSPGCPVAGGMPWLVSEAIISVEGVRDARVQLVWDPPWTQERMSEEALLQLGLL